MAKAEMKRFPMEGHSGFLYAGKPIEEMTRAELIDAVINLGTLYRKTLMRHIRDLEVLPDLPSRQGFPNLFQGLPEN